MEIEKIFKNLILIDFAILILIVITSSYQTSELSEANKYLDKGFLSNFENLKNSIINFILFIFINFELTL